MFEREEYERKIEMMNVNQQCVSPLSPFDIYWKGMTAEMEKEKSFDDVITPILNQLSSENITRLECVVGSAIYLLHHCLNHSCEPSGLVTYMERDGHVSVYAKRRIKAGEEISFNYFGDYFDKLNTKERREILLHNFKFVCQCQKCARDDEDQKKKQQQKATSNSSTSSSRGGRGKAAARPKPKRGRNVNFV